MGDFAKEVNDCLHAMQQGDRAAFDKLYVTTYNHLRYIVKGYLVNKSYLEDVLSDTYAKVMNYVHSVDLSRDGYNWICKTAQNIAYNYNEREIKIAQIEQKYANDCKVLRFDKDFDKAEFLINIRKLDEPDRQIAVMRFCQGMTYDEIGEYYGVTKVAIFQRIRKICKIYEKNYKNK